MKIQTRSSGSACKSEDHQKIRQRRDCRMKWKFRYGSPFASAGQVKIFLSLITAFPFADSRRFACCWRMRESSLRKCSSSRRSFAWKRSSISRSISEVTVLLIWSVSVELLSVTTSEKHVAEKRSYLFQLCPGNDFIRGNGSRWQGGWRFFNRVRCGNRIRSGRSGCICGWLCNCICGSL